MLGKALNAVEVVTFDYPYISGGKRKAPPKAEKLVEFHADVVKKAVEKSVPCPSTYFGREIYGIRGINGAVTAPVMFVQGSKDGLCPLEKLELVCKRMKFMNELHVIDGGDHSFKIGKKHLQTMGSTQDEAEDLAVQAIAAFICRSLEKR